MNTIYVFYSIQVLYIIAAGFAIIITNPVVITIPVVIVNRKCNKIQNEIKFDKSFGTW